MVEKKSQYTMKKGFDTLRNIVLLQNATWVALGDV